MDVRNAEKEVLLFLTDEVAAINQLSEEMLAPISDDLLKEKLVLMQVRIQSIGEALGKNGFGGSGKEKKLSAITHDINNIMTSITGFASLALFVKEPKKFQDTLRSICDASKLVSQTFEERIKFIDEGSIITMGLARTEPRVFQDLLQSALSFSQSAKNAQGKVHVYVDMPTEPIIVSTCGSFCSRVLMNLFNNAFDAIAVKDYPENNQSIWIVVTADEGLLKIQVRDNGIGMDTSVIKRIFEYGFSTKDKAGRGIGLHSCKERIEEAFGGDILVESSPGNGTVFYINIPLHKLSS